MVRRVVHHHHHHQGGGGGGGTVLLWLLIAAAIAAVVVAAAQFLLIGVVILVGIGLVIVLVPLMLKALLALSTAFGRWGEGMVARSALRRERAEKQKLLAGPSGPEQEPPPFP